MRETRITRAIQRYDRELFCERDYKGRFAIFRRDFGHDDCWLDESTCIHVLVERPQLVMHLTDNWGANGLPVDWGIDPILFRLKEIDGHSRDLMHELEASQRKNEESKDRKLASETEAFVKDWRKDFAKATSDINTSSMEKKDSRRIAERKLRYGNSK